MIGEMVLALVLAVSVVFQGVVHEVFSEEWMGKLEIFDRAEGRLMVNVSHTSGNSYEPVAVVCGETFMVAYLDDLNTWLGEPSVRFGVWDDHDGWESWSSQQVPNAYGVAPALSCGRAAIVLSYESCDWKGDCRRWYQTYAAGNDGEPAWSLPADRLEPEALRAVAYMPAVGR